MIDTVRWITDTGDILSEYSDNVKLLPGKLRLIDQVLLPEELVYIETDNLENIFDIIKRLSVRGAPAIGCAAALGLAAVIQNSKAKSVNEIIKEIKSVADRLAQSRPTAINLFWALNRCVDMINNVKFDNVDKIKLELVKEALNILQEDIEMCISIGIHGATLLNDGDVVLTHCNAGALATGDFGTALSPIYTATKNGLNIKVFSDETRPLLQGSRLTAWELQKAGIDVTTICDSMAGQVMKEGKINIIIVGSDRVAANGDAANKIGTYPLAILAKYHKIPFYVAIPYSTIDMNLKDGTLIPIEKRDGLEIIEGFGKRTGPKNIKTYNPAFDVTPNELITGIITEKGVLTPPFENKIKKMLI